MEKKKDKTAKSEIKGKAVEEGGKKKKAQKEDKAVRIVFLGGVGEIGKNMTAIECGDDTIVIDAGVTFPTDETPGFDLIVPDIEYLKENESRIRALILTHGHEDHIGGVPYFLKEINVPIVGTKLTLALADNKIREHKIENAEEIVAAPGQTLTFGCFKVRFINVNHSIPGSCALAIQTPQGIIFHSGDFKFDFTPVAGDPIDLKTISEVGAAGVRLYLGESTNIERPGFAMSERTVGDKLDELFSQNRERRIVIATFATNVYRIQEILDIAERYSRKVAFSGRSMVKVTDTAERMGELTIPKDILVDISKAKSFRDEEIVILSTGAQGEETSALTKMANGTGDVKIGDNDTVIISASVIPGNERTISRVINNLCRLGADVIYESIENIHVSGHACSEEHKIMHSLLKPRYFIPIHGEYRHLMRHARLAEEMGMNSWNIVIPDIGDCVELTKRGIKKIKSVPSGARLIEGEFMEDSKTSMTVNDRKILSEEGIIMVVLATKDGEFVGEPAINSRGFVYDYHKEHLEEMRAKIKEITDGYDLSRGVDELKRMIKRSLGIELMKTTRQSPMIVPMVIEL